jgi:hypothetical protein
MAAHGQVLPTTAGRRRPSPPAVPRLPWWALALPALAFALLLAVVAAGGHSGASATPPLADLVGHLRDLLPRVLSVPAASASLR